MILVTGGCGFIGSHFILDWLKEPVKEPVLNLDVLTYAANPAVLSHLSEVDGYYFLRGDICDRSLVDDLLKRYQPRAIVHFAAESHVDRSIESSGDFIKTNVLGTHVLLDSALAYYRQLDQARQNEFRFLHVSTDEVYGSLSLEDPAFTHTTPYAPNSPYSASKAASDHLVRAWHQTYGLPTLITHCSNNYGPHQHKEKLIPLCISKALNQEMIPIYGDGQNRRDWLHVLDHCEALREILVKGSVGSVYNIGGGAELNNLTVVNQICAYLDQARPLANGRSYVEQIGFVKDRLGHDFRYAIDAKPLLDALGWQAKYAFEEGLLQTIEWYLTNEK
jgi:dTDP-glucose 4,6-dehydratase